MESSFPAYSRQLIRRAFTEAWHWVVPETRKRVIRDVVLVLLVIVVIHGSRGLLSDKGFVPRGENPLTDPLISVAATAVALGGLFAAYLLVELLIVAPYRLWRDSVENPPPSFPRSTGAFIRELSLSAGFRDAVPPTLTGFSKGSFARLVFGVEYEVRTGSMWRGMARQLVPIATLTDLTLDQYVQVSLVEQQPPPQAGELPRLFWGDAANNYPLPYSPVRGRLVIVGPEDKQQYYYFELTASLGKETEFDPVGNMFWHPFVFKPQDELDWARHWTPHA